MGKKARLKKERRDGGAPVTPTAMQSVDRYLRAIGAPGTVADPAEFWDWLDARNGAESAYLTDFLDGVAEDSRWGARCASPRLSIDHQFEFSGRLYRPLLRALAQRLVDCEYGSVLDVGCGNGLVGCFAAGLRPGVRFVGVDVEPRALAVGEELAARLSLDTEFIEPDIATTSWPVEGPFDVVLSMRAMAGNALRLREFTADHRVLNEILGQVRGLMSEGGCFIALERLGDDEKSLAFAGAAAKQGPRARRRAERSPRRRGDPGDRRAHPAARVPASCGRSGSGDRRAERASRPGYTGGQANPLVGSASGVQFFDLLSRWTPK